MTKHFFLLLISILSISIYSLAQSDSSLNCAYDKYRLSNIDSVFTKLTDEKIMPHAVTMVMHNNKCIHLKAYGYKDIENNIKCDTNDIFRLASQTKSIVVVALMTLWEKGLFQLDDQIKKYIPEFSNPKVLLSYNQSSKNYTSRNASRDITIRDILTHTSGISKSGPHALIMNNADIPLSVSTKEYVLADVVKRMAKLPLAHDPGEKFTYSNAIDILGYLCEILSGKKIDAFLQEVIFDPLEMHDSHFYLPKEKENRLVKLYTYPKGGPLQLSSNNIYSNYPISGAKTFFSCGAGLCGTISDYTKFCQMILNKGSYKNKQILGRKTIEMMQRNNVGKLRGDIGFSLAWDYFGEEYIHKTPASKGSMRWGGMFGTDYLIDPTENIIMLMYVNWEYNGSGIDPKTLMHNIVYQALK